MNTPPRQLATLVVGLWALFLCPGLCLAGVLEHVCVECEVHADLASAHEEACIDDPCAEFAMRPDGGCPDIDLGLAPDVAVEPARPTQARSLRVAILARQTDALPPCPESNLPLLR